MKCYVVIAVKVLALVGLLGLVSASARAEDKKADATGTWKWVRKSPDGNETEISATLKQDGEKLTGKVVNPMGEIEIKDGKVKDGNISFHFTIERDGNEIKVNFSGKLEGDAIKGKIEIGDGDNKRSLDWEPKRVKEDKK